jgi:hypothetical protein
LAKIEPDTYHTKIQNIKSTPKGENTWKIYVRTGNSIKIYPTETPYNKFDWFTVTIVRVPSRERTSSQKKMNAPKKALHHGQTGATLLRSATAQGGTICFA